MQKFIGKKPTESDFSIDYIGQFADDVKAGKVKASFKSAPVPT